jgi:hypothetical protein
MISIKFPGSLSNPVDFRFLIIYVACLIDNT